MMDTFIRDLAETYIKKLQNREGNVELVEFQLEDNLKNTAAMHSDGIGGQILYKIGGNLCKCEPVFVKFVSTEDQTHKYRPFVVSLFEKEIHFYTEMVPFLNSLRCIEDLIPQFLDFKKETQLGDRIAIMFQHLEPNWLCNNFKSFLDYPHLALMMHKLGEFHAYSFAAKSKDKSQFSKLSSFHTNNAATAIKFFEEPMKQTLQRCILPLRQDQRYMKAIPRLQKLIHNYNDLIRKTYSSSPEDQHYVLGHMSYNQSNVLFSYANQVPVDMKIMDWQSSGFVSLGLDVLGVLYAEASQQTRDQYWDQLLDNYYDSLKTTFNSVVPSKDQVLEELKNGVGAAIFKVTYRVNEFHLKTGSQDKSKALWNDEFVTELLKDMINRGLL